MPIFLNILLALPVAIFLGVIVLWGLDHLVNQFFIQLTPGAGRQALKFLRDTKPQEEQYFDFHPYMFIVHRPNYSADGFLQHNRWGHRGADIMMDRTPGVPRILALGGSTTYGFLQPDPTQTWPAQLERMLSERLNRPVEVINAGVSYALSSEMLINYIMRQYRFKPDIVILHEGGNDVAPLLLPDYQPDYANFRYWVRPSLLPRPKEQMWFKSAIVRAFYAWWLQDLALSSGSMVWDQNLYNTISPEEAMRNVMNHYPIGFERNYRVLIQTIKADGALPVLFPFHFAPMSVYEVLKPPMDYGKPLLPALALGLDKHKRLMRGFAEEFNIPYHELALDAVPNTEFYDHCHLTAAGETIKAQLMADALAPVIENQDFLTHYL